MSKMVRRVQRQYGIVCASADGVALRWDRQYPPDRSTADKVEIGKKLRALISPTKSDVDAIIGNESWTGVMCGSCYKYHLHGASFGSDYPSEICVDCMTEALSDLRAEIEKAKG